MSIELIKKKKRSKTNHHGPNTVGYRRATYNLKQIEAKM